ncbi:DNA-3-methyladenine glycosylase I [Gracilinema caldarium DSM 7334]|uniref:DNA-3-methyladenine glycosylase I n=2 Tax=Gracilinema caldarium TaxID=215591 RepID=F8EZK1_GRAC1|nr:DNA-3-methyladenine glycosylase I [Gracilinema caldarium DSM 7334]
MNDSLQRCPWCLSDSEYQQYHDYEWGVPLHDEQKLFSLLILEGAQAGLSWITILKRRKGYLDAMDNLDPDKLARYNDSDITRLMLDSRIIQNRRKLESAVSNARAFLAMKERGISFSNWLWAWVEDRPIQNHWSSLSEVPAVTPLSDTISRELKRLGFTFVGPTIIYAYMQSAGLVNDHLVQCYRHYELLPG